MEDSPVSYSIRPAAEDDLVKILEIETKIHVAPWTEEHFRAEMGKPFSQVLVLTDDETDEVLPAYIVFWLMFDECQILNVAVDLPYRGRGFAKKLIRKAIDLATEKNIKRVVLDVRKSNVPAIHLYQGLKFTITQVRKSYYSNGEDAYEMTLYVDDALLDSRPELDF